MTMSLETHVPIRRLAPTTCALAAILAAMSMGMVAGAQDAPAGEPTEAPGSDGGMNRPVELPPEQSPDPETTPATPAPAPQVPPVAGPGPASGRKPAPTDELVGLQFRDQDVKTLIDTISLWTGKVVIPKETELAGQKITIVSDRKMPKSEALNLIFQAFRLNDLGVVETEDLILIDSINDLTKLQPTKVIGPEVDIADLPENGNIVVKVFRIRNTKAAQVYERLEG